MRTALFAIALCPVFLGAASAQDGEWRHFNGNLGNTKFSPADQITPENVSRLEKAWEFHTGDVAEKSGPPTSWSATPLFANDTIYFATPFYRIFALEPDTGKQKWVYDSKALLTPATQPVLSTRGAAYWEAENTTEGAACQKIVYVGTAHAKLHAVDADTGEPCADFGENGVLDINTWNTTNDRWPLSILQPPTVYKDQLFVGWAGKDYEYAVAPPGTIFAVDAQTGALNWTFHSIPPEMIDRTGTANVWTSMTVDEDTGVLYAPISSPSPNFYGGGRVDPIPLATSVVAIDTKTGEVLWNYQTVHHDLWDYDVNSAPTLVDIEKDGETVPALVQATKMGFLFVLNRETGEPVFPIEDRPVPASKVEGEIASPTQPWPSAPPPTTPDEFPGVFWLTNLLSGGECGRWIDRLETEGRFTPVNMTGNINYPATAGGVEWGGGALDPRSNTYFVNSSITASETRLIPREDYEAEAGENKNGWYLPMIGAPYGLYKRMLETNLGIPCWNPPYGEIHAYNLNTGERLWRKPLGRVQKWGFYMPHSWGSPNTGAPAVTGSGLVFIGATIDSEVRAIDPDNGDILWRGLVEAPANSIPAVYDYKGKQYVVFIAGGNIFMSPTLGDQIVAFALPD